MNIGRKIKKLRQSKGISQEEIANRVDVSQAFISSVENNKRSISIKKLNKVCNKGLLT
ncbi:MAG: helix-turn-helix domain-containing protein [Halanaerobiaceae bacterium]